MKPIALLIVSGLFASSLLGNEPIPAEITTASGKSFTGVKLRRADPDGLLIAHSGGVAKVLFPELSPEIQKQFNYDPVKALDYHAMLAEQRKAQQEVARKRAEETARVNEELEKRSMQAQKEQEARLALEAKVAQSKSYLVEILQSVDGGVLGRYQVVTQQTVDDSSGAIRRTKEISVWSEQSDEVALFRGAEGFDGDKIKILAFPDGAFEYATVLGAAKKVRAFQVVGGGQ